MRDQRSPTEEDHDTDRATLGLLLDRDNQRPWSVAEVERVIGSATTDSLNRLCWAGLIHRLGGFVWATRASLLGEQLGG
jgi:hypothetical protein